MRKFNREFLAYTILVLTVVTTVYFIAYFALKPASSVKFEEGDYSNYFPSTNVKIAIFGTSWCNACADARAYLKSMQLDFIEYDVEKSNEAKDFFAQLNGKAVPVILIGNLKMNGFNARATSKAIQILKQEQLVKVGQSSPTGK